MGWEEERPCERGCALCKRFEKKRAGAGAPQRIQHRFGRMPIRVKMEAGCGMMEILMAGCRTKILWQKWDLLIFDEGVRDSFKIYSGIQDKKQKIAHYGHHAENCNFNQAELG